MPDKEAVIAAAREHFLTGYNCSQATALAIAEAYGLETEGVAKMMNPFGAGISATGGTCGAVTGVVAGIGLLFGEEEKEAWDERQRVYTITSRYITKFTELRGTTLCNELTGYDQSDPEQYKKAMEDNVFRMLCPEIVEDSMKIGLDIIEEELGKD